MPAIRDHIKKFKLTLIVLASVLTVSGIMWLIAGGYSAVQVFFDPAPDIVLGDSPPSPGTLGISETAQPVILETDSYTIFEGVNPFHESTWAEEVTKNLPDGTEIYEVTVVGKEPVKIYRTEEGYIYKDGIADVRAARKPYGFISAEFRPKVMGSVGYINAGIAVELDSLRTGRFHFGPGGGIYFGSNGFLKATVNEEGSMYVWMGGGAGYNLWKNVDIGGYCGKTLGADGCTGGITIGIGIE